MADYGARYADRKISEVNRSLKSTYRTAQKELKRKLAEFERRFEAKNEAQKRLVESGKISKDDYKDWLTGQVFIRSQWEAKICQVSQVMVDCNRQSMRLINEKKLDVFAENYNYNAYKAEQAILNPFQGVNGMGISFDLYNSQSVARLILDDPQILPEWKIDEKKDYEWNYKKVNNIVKQGIVQGEGIPEITKRLCEDLSTMNENRMKLFARTAMTGAQNAGRQKQMEDAADMGIEVHKQWLATHDNRTRDSHRHLDGEEVKYNEDFSNGIEYPGDPDGDPAEVYNCRCTMVTIYPKYEDRSKPDWRETEEIDGQSYAEWKEGKKQRGDVKAFGFTRFTSVDYDNQNKIVDTPKDVREIIDSASKTISDDFKSIEHYIRLVGYGDTGSDDNPARCERYIPNAPPYTVGMVMSLNKKMWRTKESITSYLKEVVSQNYHIKSTDPASIIMHEYGHGIHFACALKRVGYNGYGALTKLQVEEQNNQLNLIAKDIEGIIRRTKDGLKCESALENIYEYIGEAFSDYYYGEKHEVSKEIVDYFKREGM